MRIIQSREKLNSEKVLHFRKFSITIVSIYWSYWESSIYIVNRNQYLFFGLYFCIIRQLLWYISLDRHFIINKDKLLWTISDMSDENVALSLRLSALGVLGFKRYTSNIFHKRHIRQPTPGTFVPPLWMKPENDGCNRIFDMRRMQSSVHRKLKISRKRLENIFLLIHFI